ncbi:MAG: hypothetical protein V3U98_02450 [Acidobacteriota bacterium]
MATDERGWIERLFGRRRAFLVEWRYQLRSSLLPVISVALLLVLFIFTVHFANVAATRQLVGSAPNLKGMLEGQDRAQLFMILCAAGVYLLAVLILGLIESHRTVGALHHVEKRLHALRQGDWSTALQLRRGDNLQDLAQEVNLTLQYLHAQLREDLTSLDEALEHLESAVAPGHPLGDVRRILNALRARKQGLLLGRCLPGVPETTHREQEMAQPSLS